MIGELDHFAAGVEVFATPEHPGAVWILLVDGELAFECGTCGAWWWPASDDSTLDAELECRTCELERFHRAYSWRTWKPPARGAFEPEPELTDEQRRRRELAAAYAREHGLPGPEPL